MKRKLALQIVYFRYKMGVLEELPDDAGSCEHCNNAATTKCTGCKQAIQ